MPTEKRRRSYPSWVCFIEAVAQTYSVKEVFLEISENSQENTCARVFILADLQARPALQLN